MELENIIPSEVIQSQNAMHVMYSLVSENNQKKYRIPKIQCTELKKVSKLKGSSEDV